MDEKTCFFALACSPLLPRTALKLLEHFETPRNLWEASSRLLRETGLVDHRALDRFLAFRDTFAPAGALEKLEASGMHGVSLREPAYPEPLKTIYDPPLFLFYRGDLGVLNKPCIAVVGSRNASPRGRLEARKISETLAGCGFTVVSGLARGIDREAHAGALDGEGTTAAVLGSGVDRIYPPENESLAIRISRKGVVLSEFPPGTLPKPWNFPRRNRIISGLSLGIIVVEAGEKSGALITAKFALEQGREIFALPGRPGSPLSKGTQALINQGGKIVQEIGDILEEFPYLRLPRVKKILKALENDLSRRIVETIKNQEKGSLLEDLARETRIPVHQMAGTLLQLETRGLISRLPGNVYVTLSP